MRRFVRGSIAILLAAIPAAAQSQVDSFVGPLSPGVWMSTLNIDPISVTLRNNCMLPEDKPRHCASRPDQSAAVASKSLRYVPSASRREANLAAFLKKSRATDPAGAGQLEALFAAGDIIARMGRELAPVGLRTDDLADAYALWWLNCWSAVHSDFSTPGRATVDAVKAQAARAILAGRKVEGVSEATKQEFAEALLVQALLLEAALEQAKGNPERLKALAGAANQGAKRMGLDLTTMKLTSEGFVSIG